MQLGRDTGCGLACPWPLGTLPGPSSCHGPKPFFSGSQKALRPPSCVSGRGSWSLNGDAGQQAGPQDRQGEDTLRLWAKPTLHPWP